MLIYLIPSRSTAETDILLSGVIMDCIGALHGEEVTIDVIPLCDDAPPLQSLELELSPCFNYPSLPLDDLSKLGIYSFFLLTSETTYSLSTVVHLLHDRSILSDHSILLLPISGSYLQAHVVHLSVPGSIITAATSIHFSAPSPQKTSHRFLFSSHAQQLMQAIHFSLGMAVCGNDAVLCNGLIVVGKAGSGKTTILQHLKASVECTEAIHKSALFMSTTSFAFSDPVAAIEENPFVLGSCLIDRNLGLFCIDDVDEASITKEYSCSSFLMVSFLHLLDVCFSRGIIVVVAVSSITTIPSFLRKDGKIPACFFHRLFQPDAGPALAYRGGARGGLC